MAIFKNFYDESQIDLFEEEEKEIQVEENKNTNVEKMVNLLGFDTTEISKKDMTIIKEYVK